eukprot:1175807-Prorocentrum_minimum.AAC.2
MAFFGQSGCDLVGRNLKKRVYVCDLIVEAVAALKEKSGSSPNAIAKYIERIVAKETIREYCSEWFKLLNSKWGSVVSQEHLEAGSKLAPNFKTKVLVDLLASLSESGKLDKVLSSLQPCLDSIVFQPLYVCSVDDARRVVIAQRSEQTRNAAVSTTHRAGLCAEAKPAVTPKAKAKAEKASTPAPAATPASASKGRKAAKTPASTKARAATKRAPPTPSAPAPAEEPPMALQDIKSKIELNKTQVGLPDPSSERTLRPSPLSLSSPSAALAPGTGARVAAAAALRDGGPPAPQMVVRARDGKGWYLTTRWSVAYLRVPSNSGPSPADASNNALVPCLSLPAVHRGWRRTDVSGVCVPAVRVWLAQVAEKGKGTRRKGHGLVAAEMALEAALAAVVDAEECKRAAEEAEMRLASSLETRWHASPTCSPVPRTKRNSANA